MIDTFAPGGSHNNGCIATTRLVQSRFRGRGCLDGAFKKQKKTSDVIPRKACQTTVADVRPAWLRSDLEENTWGGKIKQETIPGTNPLSLHCSLKTVLPVEVKSPLDQLKIR